MKMVEKMARALCTNDTDIWSNGQSPEDSERRRLYHREALAVLKAMREPTGAMSVAGSKAWSSKPQNSPIDRWSGALARAYSAMIDAAIAEAETP